MGGIYGALGLLAAVLGTRETGAGRDIDTNLLDIALSSLCYQGLWYLNEGIAEACQPRSAHTAETPCQIYRTRDGWLYLACILPKFWERFCHRIQRQDLLTHPRFATNDSRMENRGELTKILDGILTQKTREEWRDLLAGQVPCAPVYDIGQALDNPFVKQQGKIVTVTHPQRGQVKLIGPPFHCPGEEIQVTLAEKLGASTEAILRELGYDSHRIAALREAGAI